MELKKCEVFPFISTTKIIQKAYLQILKLIWQTYYINI